MTDRYSSIAAIWIVFLAISSAEAGSVSQKRLYLDGQYGQIHVRMAQPASKTDQVRTPVAFFHHTPGSSRLYESVAPLLARDRLVLSFDTPGYGLSDRPKAQPMIADYAETLGEAVARLVDGQSVDVVGHMTGSFIAADIAVERPEMVRRVVLSRSPVFTAETRARRLPEVRQQHADQQADPTASYLVKRLERNLASIAPGASTDPALVRFIDTVTPGEHWVFGEVAVFQYRADLRMPNITQPTLFMTYDADETRGPEWRRGTDIIPNAEAVHLTSLGSWAWQDKPLEMAEHLRAFLDAN